MTRHTPTYSLPAPEKSSPVITSDDFWALALKTAQALGAEAGRLEQIAEGKLPLAGRVEAGLTQLALDALPPGAYEIPGTTTGLPPRRQGTLLVLGWGDARTQMFITATVPGVYGPELWIRSSHGVGGFSGGFEQVYPTPVKTRTAAYPLNFPRGSDTDTRNLVQVRIPVKFGADVPEIRASFRNYDYNSDTAYSGGLNFAGVAFGKHQMNPDGTMTGLFTETPKVLRGSFISPADATTFGTEWSKVDAKAGEEYLLSYAYEAEAAGQINAYQLGTCFTNGILGSWVRPGSVTSIKQAFSPLSAFLEVKVPESTPVYSYFGDSMLAGLNASSPGRDSWAFKHAARNGAIAQIVAQPGGSLVDYADPSSSKLRMWSHLDKPDRSHVALGYNDIGNGASLSSVQARFEAAVTNIMAADGAPLYLSTVQPRASGPTLNDVRKPFNNWLLSLPMGAQMCSDHYAAVVDGSTEMTDTRWRASAGDAHLNTGGYARLADASSGIAQYGAPGLVVSNAVGRTVKVWDYLNSREQLIYGDSGVRDITALFPLATSGKVTISREGHRVFLNFFDTVFGTASGTVDAGSLPAGFYDPSGAAREVFSTSTGSNRVVTIYGSGLVRIAGVIAGESFIGTRTMRLSTNWPASLPGSAIGVIPSQ